MSCPCQHEIPPIALSLALAVLLLWVSVMCSPLKAGFVCSHRSRSLGNLITRLKALSITQITHPACTSLCYADGFQWVCVRFHAHAASAYGRVSTGYPLSTNPGSPQRQQAGRRNIFWWFSLLTPVRWRWLDGIFDQFPSHRETSLEGNQKKIKPLRLHLQIILCLLLVVKIPKRTVFLQIKRPQCSPSMQLDGWIKKKLHWGYCKFINESHICNLTWINFSSLQRLLPSPSMTSQPYCLKYVETYTNCCKTAIF